MKQTRSGDYNVPGPVARGIGNCLVSAAAYVPSSLRLRYVRRGSYYQVLEGEQVGDRQGLSINKWNAMRLPVDMTDKSVLDIGCADGYFCQLCSRRGARSVLGIDTAIGRLLRARFVALDEGLAIKYRMDSFPSHHIHQRFDYVLCLSVLHHSFVSKDLWKVLTRQECAEDLAILHQQLNSLNSLTAPQGQCVIEMPYEYDDPRERQKVDFELFNRELLKAGFREARCLGSWAHSEALRAVKDRMIYVAHA